jgi:7-carboxy-7-deazaguanine synthase
VREYNCRLVEVTGGEPLFQPNVHELLTTLCNEGYEVLLETGGSLPIDKVDSRVRKIVDIKCPSSGMMKKNHWENMNFLAQSDEVKFVIGNREDYDWAKKQIVESRLTEKCDVLMSAVFGALEPVEIAKWILEDQLNVRYQLQLHKYIWHPVTRGV